MAPIFPLLLLSALLAGCSRNEPVVSPSPGDGAKGPSAAADPVVATIGERSYRQSELDARLAGALHELEHQRYLVRREALESTLLRELGAPDAKARTARISLEPPLPPAVALTGSPAATRPADAAAPVEITSFCNFESPHCAVVQSTLLDVAQLYPGWVRIAARDLPLPMHRHARQAAEAARCAGAQGSYWPFHDLLYASGRAPDRAELERVARVTGLDTKAFDACLDTHSMAARVAADAALARDLGLGMVPAIFVNGRFATAPVAPDSLVWLVERELARLGAGAPALPARGPTRLPLVLRATIVGSTPGLGLAVMTDAGDPEQVVITREGGRPLPGAILRRVTADHVELLVDGEIETLGFATTGGTGAATDLRSPLDDEGPPVQSGQEITAAALRGPKPMAVYLDREAVRERMADRVALAAQMKPISMTVEGYRLLKLEAVPPGSLYELLGLEPGDVVVMVNEQPIHEGDNPLWDALDREDEVRVRVMRRGGVATQYVYRFQ